MTNPARYRYIQFYGGRILQAREVAEMQRIQEGLNSGGTSRVALDLDAIYREGATFNILPTLASGSVTLAPINSSLPMYIFVRGRWEILQSSEITALTLPAGGGSIYLNWVVRQVTSAEDPTLIDTNTGEPTADMGELDLLIQNVDTSAVALGTNQFEKNTATTIVFTFTSAGVLAPIDNINAVALGTEFCSGLVSLTTTTSRGVAASSDDPRLSDSRNVLDGSVHDSSVRTPIAVGGSNSDGTPIYNLSPDIGGVSSAKLVHLPGTQLVSDVIEWIKGQVSSLSALVNSHIGFKLGLPTTHPMPTPADVGATPASHVGQPLGLATSHPASVTTNSGGFSVNRSSGVAPIANDPAYGLFNSGALSSALFHNGDVFTSLLQSVIASPIGTSTTGNLSLLSTVGHVLAEHVNQTSHANPHGLAAGDIGAATTGYVDSSVANVLAQSENYTNSVVPTVTVSAVNVTLPSASFIFSNNQWVPGGPANTGRYLIIRFAPNGNSGYGAVEVAIGTGTANGSSFNNTADTIPLPNGNYSYSNFIASISPNLAGNGSRTINQFVCSLINGNQPRFYVTDNNGNVSQGSVSWTAIAWRVNA